jgi:hypothetical protein
MIRTIWLGGFLLLGIGALASFKFAFSPQQTIFLAKAAAAVSTDADPSSVGRAVAPEPLTKGDRLQIVYVEPTIDVKPAVIEDKPPQPPTLPATAVPRIISRHWHDPNDQKAIQAAKQKSKASESRKSAPVVERKPSVEVNSCKSNGLEGLRQLFNAPANCVKTN